MLVDCDMGLANAGILLGVQLGLDDRRPARRPLRARGPAPDAAPPASAFLPGHSGTGIGSTPVRGRARAGCSRRCRPYAERVRPYRRSTPAAASTPRRSASSPRRHAADRPDARADRVHRRLCDGEGAGGRPRHAPASRSSPTWSRHDVAGRAACSTVSAAVVSRFLDVELELMPARSPRDAMCARRCCASAACVEAYPSSRAARAFARARRAGSADRRASGRRRHRFLGMEALHGAH